MVVEDKCFGCEVVRFKIDDSWRMVCIFDVLEFDNFWKIWLLIYKKNRVKRICC